MRSIVTRSGRYLAFTSTDPNRSIIHDAMLWMEMNALVDGQP